MRIISRSICLAVIMCAIHGAMSVAFAEPPNIVLLMGDDHGWEETGYHGHPHVKTPVLDEMAASGLRFERFYAQPLCSPTRGSYLTGRHPNRYGTFAPGWSIRPEEKTIAHLLSDVGYRCGHFGKWHVGTVKAESPTNPGAMGFDEWLSHDNFFELDPWLSRDGAPPEKFQGESSEIIVREAIRFIDRAHHDGAPFLTVIWFGSPHEPYSGLRDDLAMYDGLPSKYSDKLVEVTSNETGEQVKRPQGEVLRERYAEITAMDRAIGQLRTYLAEQGLKRNTFLFYCGDNGTSADSSVASPHRGVKGSVYEGGVLVPGLIEWPERISKPRTTTIRACTCDLFPTVCAIAGVPPRDRVIDGIDLSSAIDGDTNERSNPICLWQYDTSRLSDSAAEPYIDPELQEGTTPLTKVLDGKATRDFKNFHQPPVTEADYLGPRAIIDGDYKLVIHELKDGPPRRELFDLETDPAETTNLIEREPAVAARLQSLLRDWQRSVFDSLEGRDYQ